METQTDIKLEGDISIWMEKKTKKIYVVVNGIKRYIEAEPCFCNEITRGKTFEIQT